MYEILQRHPGKRSILSGCQSEDYGSVSCVGAEAATGDLTAGDLVGGEGTVVLVGEVEDREAEAMGPNQPVSLGGLFQPVMKCWLGPASPLLRGHFGADDILCASEADADDYECHIGDSEMAFGAFPQAELNGTVLAEVVDAGSDGVPVKHGIFRIVSEYFGDICAEVLSANLGCIRQSSSKLGFALIGTRRRGRSPRWRRGLWI